MTAYNIVWKPLPGSQSLALSCPCNEILFEGTRGPGKTAAQLARFRRLVGLGYGSFWRGIIFDVEYKNLADIITQSKRMYRLFNDGARFKSSASELKWVWPTGEELLFRFADDEDDYWDYHGQEFPFIGFNELTKQKSSAFYEAMMSCRRSSFRPQDYQRPDGLLLPSIPLETFSTTNPFGIGHAWVKKRFIEPVPRGRVLRTTQTVFNPQTKQEEDITLTRVAIHGSYKENPYLDPVYVATLMAIKDTNKRKAWVEGSWDVTSGGRFDHLWREAVHVVKPFAIPAGWRVDRSHDWGESKPFANLWWAESDGAPAVIDGRTVRFPRGTLFLIGEWYGCPPEEMNVGLNMPSSDVARVVKWVDARLTGQMVDMPVAAKVGQMNIQPGICQRVASGPADSAIFNTGDNELSIADKMKKQGVEWIESDKRPGSRINGASLFCDMLEAAIKGRDSESGLPEEPAFYVFENCRGWISRIPVLPRDTRNPDDVDTAAEDHDWDATRYRVLAKSRTTTQTPLRL
ncbi:phage terminase large subunit [Aquitalea aquatica]|uniref:Terminase n=1 Tax=Aquitalea aquatica TaxID=3044273 RepID=A0A838XXZ7_9NEIS|nr:phage terminase large subunit [Aquitalea magnusonii]MBA4707523.1 terminase [Aquitalea magnusonii]